VSKNGMRLYLRSRSLRWQRLLPLLPLLLSIQLVQQQRQMPRGADGVLDKQGVRTNRRGRIGNGDGGPEIEIALT